MQIISLNIGDKKTVQWKNKTVKTGIFKYPVKHPLFLGDHGVENDTIVDTKHHGGIEKAVYLYSKRHYEFWRKLYPHLEWQYGMFGENITLLELDEHKIKKGDVFQLGEAIIEATKPRTPCYKLGIRFGDQKVVKQFWEADKCGIYFKVLKNGKVALKDILTLQKTDPGQPSIADMYNKKKG
ncbi:MAG: sulfurase [Flavobacteriales bacterium]|nr:MAG: sulfurase [Flavobacteriales bacterium]